MINDELTKLKELTEVLTSDSYLINQTTAWEYAFNSVSDLVSITNASCKIKFLNTNFLNKLPSKLDFYINKHIDSIFTHSDIECDTHSNDVGCSYFGERFFPELGGWFIGNRYPIRNNNNVIIGYTFMFSDITARKCAEAKWHVSEARFTDLFKYMPLAAIVFLPINSGKDFKIIDFNKTAENIEGVAYDAIIGKHTSDLLQISEGDKVFDSLKRVFDTGMSERIPTAFYQNHLINGWQDIFLMKLPSGEVVSLYTNETIKIESQLKLKCNQELLQGVLDGIPDIIGLQDINHNAIRYNKAALDIFNITHEELKTKKCYELLGRTSPCEICHTQKSKITKNPEQQIKFIEELNGWYDCRSYPLFDNSGEVVQVIEHLRDITELVTSQTQREVYYKELSDTFQRLNFIIAAVDGYIWEKRFVGDQRELVYSYINPSLYKDFFKADLTFSEDVVSLCKGAIGKTTSDFINGLCSDNKIHSFIDVCSNSDKHCLEQGVACDYFEMGYIDTVGGDTEWTILRTRKGPVFNDAGEIVGLIGFADNCSRDMYSIQKLIIEGLKNGSVLKLADTGSAKVYWVVKRKEEETNLAYNDFP